ncbi:thiamine diphosphokinase [candidate division KSB1 bacterium]|nr:thiamine diphosphokinase [candidate division KSB1 bacterium]
MSDHQPSKTVIFANGHEGDLNEVLRFIGAKDRIICANGGTRHCLKLGLTPQMIVGDMDSISADMLSELSANGVKIHRHPAKKNKTDLELALDIATKTIATSVLILTALGGRLDQLLGNILLLSRYTEPGRVIAFADKGIYGRVIKGPDTVTLHGQCGDGLSLHPLTHHVGNVFLSGTEWELNEQVLEFGSTLTISNTWKQSSITLSLSYGILLLLHRSRVSESEQS